MNMVTLPDNKRIKVLSAKVNEYLDGDDAVKLLNKLTTDQRGLILAGHTVHYTRGRQIFMVDK